jgi:hypothetical protein
MHQDDEFRDKIDTYYTRIKHIIKLLGYIFANSTVMLLILEVIFLVISLLAAFLLQKSLMFSYPLIKHLIFQGHFSLSRSHSQSEQAFHEHLF